METDLQPRQFSRYNDEVTGFDTLQGHTVEQTASGAHPTSYSVGIGDSDHGIKQPRCEADYAPPCSAEVKNEWSYTSASPVYLPKGVSRSLYLFIRRVINRLQ